MKRLFSSPGGSWIALLGVVVSSACCVGPLSVALSFIGLSGSTLLAVENVMGPFRPYILVATAGFLGLGFYTAYRPQEACEPGKTCARPESRRTQRIFLWIATPLLLILLYFTYIHPNLDVYFGIYL